ncbi:MAG: MarR family transcriptional regulator [bacterium]
MSKALTQTSPIFTRSTAKLLHRATYLMDKAAEKVLQKEVGIGLSQFLALMQMGSGQQCQRELSVALGVTPAAISRQVSIMIESGLLKKLEHDHDRRYEFLVLTAKGARLSERATQTLEREFGQRYAELTVNDRSQIHDSLMKLMACYENSGDALARAPDVSPDKIQAK